MELPAREAEGKAAASRQRRPLRAYLPLPPLTCHILLALADEDLHGYGILRKIPRLMQGRTIPASGPVYLAAKRLLTEGLLEETGCETNGGGGIPRGPRYRLTAFGREVAKADLRRMANLLELTVRKGLVNGKVRIGDETPRAIPSRSP